MENNITLKLNNLKVGVEFKTFMGGEEQVAIDISQAPHGKIGFVNIHAKLKSSQDFMRLLVLENAVRRLRNIDKVCEYTLEIPYFPYARQDRVMNPGEALSLEVATGLINGMNFDRVIIDDPHSDVTTFGLHQVHVRTQDELFAQYWCEKRFKDDVVVIAPDAGARKKAQRVANRISKPLIVAGKDRSLDDNGISGTEVYGDVAGLNCIIVDDICDGGRTFMALARVLKEKGAKSVLLYVTHGIFSYGKNDIRDAGVDAIHAFHDWHRNF